MRLAGVTEGVSRHCVRPCRGDQGTAWRGEQGELAGVTKSVSLQGWDLGVGPQGWEGVYAGK